MGRGVERLGVKGEGINNKTGPICISIEPPCPDKVNYVGEFYKNPGALNFSIKYKIIYLY